MDAIGKRSYEIAVAQLRKRLVTGDDGRDVVARQPRPLSLQIGNSGRAEHATETRALSTPPPKADRFIG
jgi:hypothetical protein